MTARDYRTLAGALHAGQPGKRSIRYRDGSTETVEDRNAWDAWRLTVEYVADALAADSPQFDRERFVLACETGRGI